MKILKSKASTISFITMSGCLNPITHMLSHHDPRVVNYAVKIYEAMLDSWVGGAPKKGVGKKAGGGKGGGEGLAGGFNRAGLRPAALHHVQGGEQEVLPDVFRLREGPQGARPEGGGFREQQRKGE